MRFGDCIRTLAATGAIAIAGAPDAALVTATIVGALAVIGLIVILAFETMCERDRLRARQRRHATTKPDRALRRNEIPRARVV